MCRAVKCRQCGKTTWSGCGLHADQVLRNVLREDRCAGHEKQMASVSGGGIFSRLFGR